MGNVRLKQKQTPAPLKYVPVGTEFTGVTHTGRDIAHAKVIQTGPLGQDGLPHLVQWRDKNGKHYEFFDLHEPARTFREFKIINSKEA